MSYYTIGYRRDDGDFAILAALNNIDGHLTDARFASLAETIMKEYKYLGKNIEILERKECEDYIDLEE